MQPLEAKVHCEQWPESPLLKVAGLAEFAAGSFPTERMLLDLRDTQVRAAGSAICRLPWAGFLTDGPEHAPPDRPWIAVPQGAFKVDIGDVVELRPHTSKMALRYRRGSNNNILFTTERCNSYCLMCSQPPRKVDDGWRVSQLCNLIELIDKDAPSELLPASQTPSLGVMMKAEVANGNETDVQSGVQA